jgi:hypothetical protein
MALNTEPKLLRFVNFRMNLVTNKMIFKIEMTNVEPIISFILQILTC